MFLSCQSHLYRDGGGIEMRTQYLPLAISWWLSYCAIEAVLCLVGFKIVTFSFSGTWATDSEKQDVLRFVERRPGAVPTNPWCKYKFLLVLFWFAFRKLLKAPSHSTYCSSTTNALCNLKFISVLFHVVAAYRHNRRLVGVCRCMDPQEFLIFFFSTILTPK